MKMTKKTVMCLCSSAVAWGLAARAFAAGFVYVSPSDLQGRKVTETPVNQANFVRLAPDITTYAPSETIQPVLLESLRRMGAELLARVAFDPADTPSGLRVRAGFAACLSGEWDGAYLVGMDKLEGPFAAALAAAKDDASLVVRFRTAVEELLASGDAIKAAEGRRARMWLRRQDAWHGETDDLRTEIGEWLRHLEAVAGRPRSPYPEPAAKVVWKPGDPPQELKAVQVKTKGERAKLDADGKIVFTTDGNGFAVTVEGAKDCVTIELDLPGPDGSRLRYGGELVHRAPQVVPDDLPPKAWFLGRGEINYIQERFDDCFMPGDWRPRHHGAYCRAYPGLGLSGDWMKPGKNAKGPEKAVFRASWMSLWGQWPGCVDGRIDRWRVTVGGDGPTCDVRLQWPRGATSRREIFEKDAGINKFQGAWDRRVAELSRRYSEAADEFRFAFKPVEGQDRHLGDVKSAQIFRDAYLQPLLGRRATVPRYMTLAWDAADARRLFLQTARAGKPFKKPPVREKTAVEAATAPDADLDTGMQLDEEGL